MRAVLGNARHASQDEVGPDHKGEGKGGAREWAQHLAPHHLPTTHTHSYTHTHILIYTHPQR